MKLSIIICTYNRAKYIRPLLDSIVANDLPKQDYEIILVDNNCTDNTRDICCTFASDHADVMFRYTIEPQQGLSAARNKGIKEATGDILVYIDDDAIVDTWYLRTITEYMDKKHDCMACGGPIIPLYETKEPQWMSHWTKELLTAYMYFGDKERVYPGERYPGGGNAAYRTQVFKEVGLFNTDLGRKGDSLMGAEEKDIFDKMRAKAWRPIYLPQMILHHIIPQKKLEQDYFDRLTLQMGKSERQRTLAISKSKYATRLLKEGIKWGGTIVLWFYFLLILQPQKGNKLISFRANVTRGLLGIISES